MKIMFDDSAPKGVSSQNSMYMEINLEAKDRMNMFRGSSIKGKVNS